MIWFFINHLSFFLNTSTLTNFLDLILVDKNLRLALIPNYKMLADMAAIAEQLEPTQRLLNVNMVNVNKLTSTNYMTWSLQLHALLDGYSLAGYVNGSTPAPPQTITVNDQPTVNPEYTKWCPQDRLIYSGLIGTL